MVLFSRQKEILSAIFKRKIPGKLSFPGANGPKELLEFVLIN